MRRPRSGRRPFFGFGFGEGNHHRHRLRRVGKWETCFWFSTFPSGASRGGGNVGISPACGEISKGLVERVGSLVLAFHAFHSPGISTAPGPSVSQPNTGGAGYNNLHCRSKRALAACIRLAHWVSLICPAICASLAQLTPGLSWCVASGRDFSFSYGVR